MSGERRAFGRCMILGAAWLAIAFLVLPMLVVFPVSLTDRYFLSLPQDALSFEHYANFFHSAEWLSATWQSFAIGVSASIAAMALGSLCAIGCWRLSSRASEIVRALMLTPIIVPAIVHALAFNRTWVQLDLLDSYLGVILAHALIGMPYVVITVSASLANFDPKLEQAARNLGASLWQTVRYVIVPAIRPGVLSGGAIAFAISFDDIVVVLFITSRHIYTLPKRIWNGIQDHLDPTIAVVASLLIATTFAIVMTRHLVEKHRQLQRGVGATEGR